MRVLQSLSESGYHHLDKIEIHTDTGAYDDFQIRRWEEWSDMQLYLYYEDDDGNSYHRQAPYVRDGVSADIYIGEESQTTDKK